MPQYAHAHAHTKTEWSCKSGLFYILQTLWAAMIIPPLCQSNKACPDVKRTPARPTVQL